MYIIHPLVNIRLRSREVAENDWKWDHLLYTYLLCQGVKYMTLCAVHARGLSQLYYNVLTNYQAVSSPSSRMGVRWQPWNALDEGTYGSGHFKAPEVPETPRESMPGFGDNGDIKMLDNSIMMKVRVRSNRLDLEIRRQSLRMSKWRYLIIKGGSTRRGWNMETVKQWKCSRDSDSLSELTELTKSFSQI